jgi:prepilin-type N-terminal cleavage/methylation domain-containing protein
MASAGFNTPALQRPPAVEAASVGSPFDPFWKEKLMPRSLKSARRGLTLIELIVVVAILAVLAMIVIPKLDGIQGNANHAVGATSASDTSRYIQTYRAMKQRFPDGWDSLLDGTTLWNAADPTTNPVTRGLHTQLVGTSGKLTTTTLSTTEFGQLNSAGIYTLYHANTSTSVSASARPSDMFTTSDTLADGDTVATPNAGSSGGRKIIDHIYRANLGSGGTSGAIPAGRKLVVFGFGSQNKVIGSLMHEAPLYPNVDHQLVYGRNLVVFEVGGARATIKAVLGADGDLLDDLATYMSRDLQ